MLFVMHLQCHKLRLITLDLFNFAWDIRWAYPWMSLYKYLRVLITAVKKKLSKQTIAALIEIGF